MTRQTKPKRLASGARIGIVNPAYWLEAERLERAVGVLENLGYELVLGARSGHHGDVRRPNDRCDYLRSWRIRR